MIEFKKLGANVEILKEFLPKSEISFCDISLGIKYMWREDFVIDYAIFNNTLIMKESTPEYTNAFYYPIGDDVDGALTQIEQYAKSQNLPLKFCCLDNFTVANLSKRYGAVSISNDRNWSDYIYDAEKFKTYSGKKFSGQRNHVNKFKRLYPDYSFKVIEREDFPRIKTFLDDFSTKNEFMAWTEEIEQRKVFDLVENMFDLEQVGGLIEVGGKVVAFSLGEVVNDVLIVHIEKALKNYDGIYPTMAQEFARAFAGEKIKLINREEDCGDEGLRVSKLQYQPIEVKEKNFLEVRTLFDSIVAPVVIQTERLTVSEILPTDAEDYKRLYLDDDLNKWWVTIIVKI